MIARAIQSEPSLRNVTAAAFAVLVLGGTIASLGQPVWLVIQLALCAAVAASGTWLWLDSERCAAEQGAALQTARAELLELQQRTSAMKSRLAAAQARLVVVNEGLGNLIERQFSQWSLSGAEAEVALLLLKGLSLKEIAELRETSERTTRKQAQAIYRKASIAGRAELSAFFLEDLLSPAPPLFQESTIH